VRCTEALSFPGEKTTTPDRKKHQDAMDTNTLAVNQQNVSSASFALLHC
jgi:hypothetical protein